MTIWLGSTEVSDGSKPGTTYVDLEVGVASSPARVRSPRLARHHCGGHSAGALVGDADVVVNLLGSQTGNEIGRQVAAARRPPPLVLEVRPRYEAELDGMPDGRSVKITKRVSRSNLLASIREALRRSSQGPPMWGDGSP